MKGRNPIIDEVRAARDAIAKASNYDIAKIVAAVRVREAESGRTFVSFPPRPAVTHPATRPRPAARPRKSA